MTKKIPKISVIMPVYNSAEFLPETLEHIFSQSFIDFELLAINDGSNDNSLDILHDYAKRDERLSIETIENSGAGIARNRGLDLARGDYICFVDSDDIPTKRYLETLSTIIKKDNADLACIDHTCFRKTPPEEHFSERSQTLNAPEAISRLLLEKIAAAPHCKIYRRELLGKLRFESFSIAEDLYFNYQYMKRSHRITINQSRCYGYRRNNHGLSRSTFNPNRLDGIIATKLILEDSHTDESKIRFFMEAEYVLEAIARSKTNHSSEAEICKDIIREYRDFVLESPLASSRQKRVAKLSFISESLVPNLVAAKNRFTK